MNDKPKGMDLQVFKIISLVGKPLALIPFSNENATPNCFPRLYPLLLFLLYMIGGIATFSNRTSHYANLSTMQFVLRVLLDLDLHVHNFYTIIIISMFKQRKWTTLIKNLENVGYHQVNERSPYLTFIISHLVLWTVTRFLCPVWIYFIGVTFLKLYCVEYFIFFI
jgi:hypothetical protein